MPAETTDPDRRGTPVPVHPAPVHPAPAGRARTGSDEPSELLLLATRTLRRRWAKALEPWALSPHQFRALRAIRTGDGERLSDIAQHLRIAPRSATEVVDSLEEKGLVARSPSPTDRRAVVVHATERGRAVGAEVEEARAAQSAEFLAPLDPQEWQTLAALLRRLIAD